MKKRIANISLVRPETFQWSGIKLAILICIVVITKNQLSFAGHAMLLSAPAITDTIWYEDFNNLPDGVTMHAGEAGWDRNLQNANVSGHFQVENHKYEANYVNSEVLWVSEYINIKFFQNVGIRVDLASAGVLESSDSVNVYYRLDNGTPVPLQNAKHNGNFSPVTATASGIAGEKLQIIAHFRNGAEGEIFTMDNVYVTAESVSMPDNLVWYETFNDLPDNTTADNGPSAWTRDISATSMSSVGYFDIQQYRLLGRDLNGEAVWISQVIDISGHQSVDISADIYGYGYMESTDYIKVFYKLNGGPETQLTSGVINGTPGDLVTAYKNNLSGNTVQFVARTLNTSENERYVLDNVLVKSDGIVGFTVDATGGEITCTNSTVNLNVVSSESNVTYSWSGPEGFSSNLQNPSVSTAGTYTVTVTYNSISQTATATVTENTTPPDLSVSKSGSLSVSNPSVTLTASSTAADVTYSWDGFPAGENPVSVTDPGTYHVTVTNNANGCTGSSSIEVTEEPYIIWYEDFDNLPDGVTMHAGEAGWDRNLQNANVSGHFQVENHKYEANYVNSEVLWVSEYINIKFFQNVGIRVDLASAGVLESSDSVNVYYRLDNGTPVPLQNAKHNGNFSPVTATASGIAGEKLQIIAHFRNGAEGEIFTMDNVYVTAESVSMPDNLVWYETFNDLPDNTTADNGPSAWTRDISATSMSSVGYFDIQQYRLLGRDLNGEAVWISQVIDISGHQSVDISADIYGYGYMESEDYIKIYYKLNGGPETLLINGAINGSPADLITAYKNNLSGNTVQFVARTLNTTENERYVLDNVLVKSNGTADFVIDAKGGRLTCFDPVLSLNVVSSVVGVSYLWSGPEGFTSSVQNPAVTVPGDYIVTVTYGSQSKTDTAEVQQDTSKPGATAFIPDTLTCDRNALLLSAASPASDIRYKWTGPGGYISTQQNTVTSIPGQYLLYVTNPLNGCVSADTVEVMQNITPPEDVLATVHEILTCVQTSIMLNGSSGTSGVTWEWSGPDNFVSTEQNPLVTKPGNYSLLVTDPVNGCSSSASISAEQDTAHPSDVTATVSGILTCADTTVTLTGSSGSDEVTYSWSDPNGVYLTGNPVAVSVPGTYILTVTSSVNGCSESTSITVEQDTEAPAGLTASASDTLGCTVSSGELSASSTTAGVTYRWEGPFGFVSNDQYVVTSIPGIYSVTAIDPNNGCISGEEVVVVWEECQEP